MNQKVTRGLNSYNNGAGNPSRLLNISNTPLTGGSATNITLEPFKVSFLSVFGLSKRQVFVYIACNGYGERNRTKEDIIDQRE